MVDCKTERTKDVFRIGEIVGYCKCGCEQSIIYKKYHKYNGIPKYIYGHQNIGRYCSQETRIKISQSETGIKKGKAWNKGLTKSTDKRVAKYADKLKNCNHLRTGCHLTEETKKKISQANKGKYFTENHKKHIGDSHRGLPSPFKGIKRSLEFRKKVGESLKGRNAWNKGIPISQAQKDALSKMYKDRNLLYKTKMRISQSLLKHYSNIKQDERISSLYERIRKYYKYRQWRSDVFKRDNFTCQECGDDRGGNLNAHHIESFISIIQKHEIITINQAIECEALWNINNGITLCKTCHITKDERE